MMLYIVQVEATKQKLDLDEGGLGQVNIEIRYIQEMEEKNISLQGWGFGPWEEPFVETPSHPRKWGKFLLLLAVQDEQKAIPEKMVLRKYNVTFSANYVEKQEHPNTDSWMLVTKTGWEPKVVIDKAVQEKIKEKRTVQIQEQRPRGEPEN